MIIQEALKISPKIRRMSWTNSFYLIFDSTGVRSNCNLYEKSDTVLGKDGLNATDWVALVEAPTEQMKIDNVTYTIIKKALPNA